MTIAERWGRFVADGTTNRDYARDVRRQYGVHFYQGRNGASKSMLAVFDSLPDLDAGVPVLSTVRLLDWRNPRPCEDEACPCDKADESRHRHAHPSYRKWTRWSQMLELRNGVLLADEVTGVADSMDGASIPAQVADELHQLRRKHVVLRMTGLNFTRAHKRIREATVAVTRCTSSMPVPRVDENGEYRPWRARRLADWMTYDAQTLPIDDLTESAFEKADLIIRARAWIPDLEARDAYDTFDAVDRIGTVTEAGRCAHCAGRRVAPECSCPDYESAKDARSARRSARRAAPSTAEPSTVLPVSLPAQGTRRVVPIIGGARG